MVLRTGNIRCNPTLSKTHKKGGRRPRFFKRDGSDTGLQVQCPYSTKACSNVVASVHGIHVPIRPCNDENNLDCGVMEFVFQKLLFTCCMQKGLEKYKTLSLGRFSVWKTFEVLGQTLFDVILYASR